MTFRARLLLALLCLALVPTLILTLFALNELRQTTARWYSPGVDRALGSSVEVSRVALTRVEATMLERADDWAIGMGAMPLDAARRAGLRDGLREAGLDLVQIYHREAGHWVLRDHVTPAGVLTAESLDVGAGIDSALATDRLVRSPQGVLAAVARADSATVVVTGVRLTPDFFGQLRQIVQARALYGGARSLSSLYQTELLMLLALLAIAIAVGAFVVARVLSRQLTHPLRQMSAAFERVAGGDLDTRVMETGAAELRSLAASFNAMTASLAQARVSLAEAERDAAWREAAKRLAHEIKNPLTPMHLSLHRLQRRVDIVPEDQRAVVRDSLAALLQEVEHLTQLAERFSQFARLPEATLEPQELSALARAAAALHEPERVALALTCDAPVHVRGDRLLLSRAIHNLLLNAIEASPDGATVEMLTAAGAGEGWVEIRDRGPGLKPDVREKLFEPYVSTKNRGSGLGLSLVRDIATQHGGRVTLEDREGGGAVARLTLPLI
jgi:nitrogen fixation/metabolism regulation signal transduction histidine kinase